MKKLISLNDFTCYKERMNSKNLIKRLRDKIMKNIYENCRDTAKEHQAENNFMLGANIAGFKRVAEAMVIQGLV